MRRVLAVMMMALNVANPAWAEEDTVVRAVPESKAQMQLSFAPVVKKVTPAVVNIYTTRKQQVRVSPFMNDPIFGHFFGQRFGQLGERTVASLGSGVIIDAKGMIVTSNHVIKDSQEVKVALSDRREFAGKIILTDEKSDLALLQIDAGGEALPFLPLRKTDSLEVGDLVLAVGNPFGVGQTVTSGIISALARSSAIDVADYQFFIQTDAAINPGNSGGALVDMQGHLIGVNTAIYSTSGASNGIGFAIPADMVGTVVASAKQGGTHVVRPWLGLDVQPVTSEIAESMGLKIPTGVLVKAVNAKGPAADSGLKAGDVILSVNGNEVADEKSLQFRAALIPIGQKAEMVVLRGGVKNTLQVKMVAPPETPARDTRTLTGNHPFNGVTVANLSPAVAVELDMPMDAVGVVITSATGNRFFGPGDRVLAINGAEIKSTAQLAKTLQSPAQAWQIVFQRGNQVLTLNIR